MPWICDCVGGFAPVRVYVDFAETAKVRLHFVPGVRDPHKPSSAHYATKIVQQQREPADAPRCLDCSGPALWQPPEEDALPVRRLVPNLTATLLHNGDEHASWVAFAGEYPPPEFAAAMKECGFTLNGSPTDPRYPPDVLKPGMETDWFVPPDLQDADVSRANLHRLRLLLLSWGVPLAGPRRRTLAESM